MKRVLKIAVQGKGRLHDKSVELLRSIGLEFDASSRRLYSLCRALPIEIIYLRDDDIPEYVQDGVCHIGIVGLNEVLETGADVDIIRRLNFSKCRLSIAAPINSGIQTITDLDGKRIATSYPNVLTRFLKEHDVTAEPVSINGSVEICPSLGVADAIFDLVSTGTTLEMNHLDEIHTVLKSEAVWIGNRNIENSEALDLLNKLNARIDAHLIAVQSKYLALNIPTDQLEAVVEVLPALNAPTILPLRDQSMVAVHTVIRKEGSWELVEQLRDIGATGILISEIEKVMP